jgi:thiol-disulfide isomerase/thioredoxin
LYLPSSLIFQSGVPAESYKITALVLNVNVSCRIKRIDMNRTFSLLLLAAIISTSSFSQVKGKFKIIGKAFGFSDSTVIYLYKNHVHQADLIDSTLIINNAFQFDGSLNEPVINAIIQTRHIANFNTYKYFWLENSTITFTAQKENFINAVITGSKTQDEQNQFDSVVEINGHTDKEKCISYILSHPNSIISTYYLDIFEATWGKDTSANLYHHLSKQMQNTSFGKDVFGFITLSINPKVGDKYVDFTEPNVEGKNISLSDFKGKVVLLDFWGSWCGACREGNPKLVKIYNEFNAKGFEILGVAADVNKVSWINAIKKDRLPWQNVTDLQGWNNKAAIIYAINKYPTNYLINKQGIIVGIDLNADELRAKIIESLLN